MDQRSPEVMRPETLAAEIRIAPGGTVTVGQSASVQFRTPFQFRIIRIDGRPTYPGWAWLDGYELDSAGLAVQRRSIFVRLAGLR